MYVIQIDVDAAQSKGFCALWPGYWAGIGYVEKPEDAILFVTKQQAALAAMGQHLGLNGCMKIICV